MKNINDVNFENSIETHNSTIKVIIDIKISPYRILQEHEIDDAEV